MKKLISLILALTFVLSSVSVLASNYYDGYQFMDDVFKLDVGDFVAGEGGAANGTVAEETKIMLFLESLGLWDDASIAKDELVAMQEFSKILSKVKLGAENAFSKIYDLNPNAEYATYNNAYTYLVEALGYSYKCKQYPNAKDANIIVAAEIGLLNERPENIDAYITRGELAKLIYKAMNMDLCVIEYPSDGGYTHTVVEGKTLLNSVHGIFVIEGFVNGIPGLNVYKDDKIRDGYFQINRRNIKSGEIDVTKYFASRVCAYAKYDDVRDEHTLIAIDFQEDSESFEVDFRNLTYVNSYEIGYLDKDGNEKAYNVSNLHYILLNGETIDSISQIRDLYSENEGLIHFVSSTESGEIDTAVIYNYNYFVVNNIDTRLFRIALRYNRTYNGLPYIQLDDKASIDIYIDGVKSEYSKLVPGSVIKVFQCPSTGYTWINALSVGEIVAEPEMLYDDMVVFGEKEYRLAKDWELFVDDKKDDTSINSAQRLKELELGVITTFYIIDGIIAAYTSTQSYKYGYIKSVSKSRTSIDPELTFRIFTQDGEWVNYILKEKLEFEGEKNVSSEDILSTINNETRIGDFFDHPIRFRANGDKELLALDTIYESQYELETDEDMVFTQYLGMAREDNYESVGRDQPFFLSSGTVIFVCPDGSDDEADFKVIKNTQMPPAQNSVYVPTKIYNINQSRQISVMIVTRGLTTTGGVETFYYIEKITNAVIDADDQIYGYKVSGKEFKTTARGVGTFRDFSFYADEKMIDTNDVQPNEEGYSKDNVLDVGDLIRGTLAGSEIASWNMILKGGEIPEPTTDDDSVIDKKNLNHNTYVAAGKFVYADTESGVWVVNVDGVEMPSIPSVTVIINPVTHKIFLATASDFIKDEKVYYHSKAGRGDFFIKNEY